jgi:hypothetical protein
MVKIVKFDNVMIIFLSIFLFAMSVEGKSFFFLIFSNVVIWFILSHFIVIFSLSLQRLILHILLHVFAILIVQ